MAVEITTEDVAEAEPVPDRKPSRRRRGTSALIFVAIAILLAFGGVATLLLLPPSSSLQAYISPPIDASGMRVKMKIPAGWSEVSSSPIPGGLLVALKPPDRLPDWLTRFGRPPWVRGEPVVLTIVFQGPQSAQTIRMSYAVKVIDTRDIKDPFANITRHEAERSITSPDGKYEALITYMRIDKAIFDRTAETVLNSVRIER